MSVLLSRITGDQKSLVVANVGNVVLSDPILFPGLYLTVSGKEIIPHQFVQVLFEFLITQRWTPVIF
jgi:hypothetical protein